MEDSSNATVQFGIPKRLRMILARSNPWGRIRCEIAYAMTSKYAIALYEMICLRANLDRVVETIEMAKFRELLGVPPGAYDQPDNFKRFVIEPAELEVNGLSDMGVRIEMVRKHPRAAAHAVAICWWRKTGDEFRAAMQEQNSSKLGRMSRLRGQADKISAANNEAQAALDAELEAYLAESRAKEKEQQKGKLLPPPLPRSALSPK